MSHRVLVTFALFSLFGAPSLASAQLGPPPGAWFRYAYVQEMALQGGAYIGYWESTRADARYEISRLEGDQAVVRARYAWRYVSSDRERSDSVDRNVTFSIASRHYTSTETDSSDYDGTDPTTLATWIWISPTLQPGDNVEILEHTFQVISRGETHPIQGVDRSVIEVSASYASQRNDEYGSLTTRITDEYWFDLSTGMFLRERHTERADGTLDGQPASFELATRIDLVDASYAPSASPPPEPDYQPLQRSPSESRGANTAEGLVCIAFIALFSLGAAFLFLFIPRMWRRRSTGQVARITGKGEPFQTTPVTAPLGPTPLNATFDPLIAHMVSVTLAAGQRVEIARTPDGRVLGLAMADQLGGCGTIFAEDSEVCEALRRAIGQTEFFSDRRHGTVPSVQRTGVTAPPEAYNVYETFEVLELRQRPLDLGFDAELVGQMTSAERGQVLALLQLVYGSPADPWLDASMKHGDLVWVARDRERVVGVAMASLVDGYARLHSLTMHADYRNQGFGTALYRARLRALFDLDASVVITECATWNVAALGLAHSHGFTKVGLMYVESAASQRSEKRFLRR